MAKPKQRGKPGFPIPAYEPGMGRGQGGDSSASGSDGAVYGRRGPGSMRMQLTAKTKANAGSKAKAKATPKMVAAKPRQASKKKGK
jgi:hypothetical protein